MRSLGGGDRRRGASLPELLVALALFGVVATAVLRALDRQARFHDGTLAILASRAQLAATHRMVAAELRSTGPGDLQRLADSAVVYRAVIGSALLCAVSPPTVDLAPELVAAGQALARVRTPPLSGDTLWLLDDGVSPGAADDAWLPVEVRSAARVGNACAGTPWVDPVLDAGRGGWSITVSPGSVIPATVRRGAPARLTRHARFALYRAASGDANLGWTEWNAAARAWNVIQPVSGPFLPYNRSAPSASGIVLVSRDTLGAAAAAGGAGALVLWTRAATTRAVRMDGVARGAKTDSLRSYIGLRNRQ
jgi:prepilin-type N-terminal cleavage/methylation domain-containing protein